MFLELIAIFVAGFGAAGIALLVNRLSGGRLPRWVTPLAAGATMLAVAIWSEYSWAQRTAQGLPDGVEVVEVVHDRSWWRPWTRIWPRATRLMALDTDTVRTNDAAPGTRLVDLYLFGRWQPAARRPQLIRCAPPARADVRDATLAAPETASWHPVPAGSDLVRLACED
jgi:hypothetical protein